MQGAQHIICEVTVDSRYKMFLLKRRCATAIIVHWFYGLVYVRMRISMHVSTWHEDGSFYLSVH